MTSEHVKKIPFQSDNWHKLQSYITLTTFTDHLHELTTEIEVKSNEAKVYLLFYSNLCSCTFETYSCIHIGA